MAEAQGKANPLAEARDESGTGAKPMPAAHGMTTASANATTASANAFAASTRAWPAGAVLPVLPHSGHGTSPTTSSARAAASA